MFCKLDCSQAYHCLQMADYQSIELFAFNFASRTFAYRRLAQGLNLSLPTVSSFIREYLDRVLKADQCRQNVDVFGVADKTTQQMIKKLGAVFKCLRKADRKLSLATCLFRVQEIDFFECTITTKGVTPQKQKIAKFLEKLQFPQSKQALQRCIVFLIYYRNCIPRLQNNPLRFFNHSKQRMKKRKF